MLIPIVGIRHYISDTAAFLDSLTPGISVILLYEDDNLRDKTAIQAWIDDRLVGYVSSDFTLLLRANYPDQDAIYSSVGMHELLQEDNAFFVEVPIHTYQYPPYNPCIPLTPVHDVPLPRMNKMQYVQFLEVMRTCEECLPYLEGDQFDDVFSAKLLRAAKQFAAIFGHSLSGDERHIYTFLMGELMAAISLSPANVRELYVALVDLQEVHHDYVKTASLAAVVMQAELDACRPLLQPFLQELHCLVDSGVVTAPLLHKAVDAWLRALPDNLYAHLADPQELASRLFYLRLSTEELHAVYTYLLLREEFAPASPRHLRTSEKTTFHFSYWEETVSAYQRQVAIKKMRKAYFASSYHATTALVRCIRVQQRESILCQSLTPVRQFTEQLNKLLSTSQQPVAIKPNSMARALASCRRA